MGISQLGKGSQRGAHLFKELPHSSVTFSDCLLGETGSQAMIPPGPHLDKVAWLCMPLVFTLTLNLTGNPKHRPEGSLDLLPLPILASWNTLSFSAYRSYCWLSWPTWGRWQNSDSDCEDSGASRRRHPNHLLPEQLKLILGWKPKDNASLCSSSVPRGGCLL